MATALAAAAEENRRRGLAIERARGAAFREAERQARARATRAWPWIAARHPRARVTGRGRAPTSSRSRATTREEERLAKSGGGRVRRGRRPRGGRWRSERSRGASPLRRPALTLRLTLNRRPRQKVRAHHALSP